MKYIFDLDDVILRNTSALKPYIFGVLEHQYGIPEEESNAFYQEVRGGAFSLKDFLRDILNKNNKPTDKLEELYTQIIKTLRHFRNEELIILLEEFGPENCYLVTYGDPEYQQDKIRGMDIGKYFKKIVAVTGSKRDTVVNICAEHPTEKVVYVDDRQDFLDSIESKDAPNLVKVRYKEGESGAHTHLLNEIRRHRNPEIVEVKRRA